MAARPAAAAEDLLKRHGIDRIPVDVQAIAEGEGAVIAREVLDRSVSGLLLREGAAKLIAVNSTHAARRQRFTIAHELGHLVLHPGRDYLVDSTVRVNFRDDLASLATDREEIQANAFAASLLMPAKLVHAAVSALRDSQAGNAERVVEQLAAQFDVSEEAMGYRLINLGIST